MLHELFGEPEKTTTTNIVCTKKEPSYEEPMTLLARFVDQFTGIAEVMSSTDFFFFFKSCDENKQQAVEELK